MTKKIVRTVIPYKDMPKVINRVRDPQAKAFIALHYAFALRVSESMAVTSDCLKKECKDYDVWAVPNAKNKTKKTKTVLLLKEKEPWLYEPIMAWFKKHKRFRYKDRDARRTITRWTGVNSHSLRHSRLTTFVRDFGVGAKSEELVALAGWEDSSPSKIYIHIDPKIKRKQLNDLKTVLLGEKPVEEIPEWAKELNAKLDLLLSKIES